jgi:hypothetical protein
MTGVWGDGSDAEARTPFHHICRAHVRRALTFVQVDLAFAHMRKVAGAHSALGPDHTVSDMLVTAFLNEAIERMFCDGSEGYSLADDHALACLNGPHGCLIA